MWWINAAIFGDTFFGGIVGNLAAAALWEVGRWGFKPILDKIPDIAKLLADGVSQGNHDLLRALRRAECSVLVWLCDEALHDEFDFRGDQTLLTERITLWLREYRTPDLGALCRIRRVFDDMHERLRTTSVNDLVRLQGAIVSEVPLLIKAGSECFSYDDFDQMRDTIVARQVAALDRAVRGIPEHAGLTSPYAGPLAPSGLPAALTSRMVRHPQGWWDLLRQAFREELKDPANERARAAWQFDVLNQLPQQLGATYDEFDAKFSTLDARLSGAWNDLKAFKQQFDVSTVNILDLLQRTVENTDGTRIALEHLHLLSEKEFATIKELLSGLIKPQPRGFMPTATSTLLVDYCTSLERILQRLLPLGTDHTNNWAKDVMLARVYVDLDTTSYDEVVNDEATPLSVLNAVARNERLVLLGDAGSGKSTFITYLALYLAAHITKPDAQWLTRLPGLNLDRELIPIRIVLQDFATWRPHTGKRPNSGDFRGFIRNSLDGEGLSHEWPPLEHALKEGRAIVLFDGLDEISDATARIRTRTAIADFMEQYPKTRCVVTCRVLAYEDESLHFENIPSFRIAPLDDPKIESFISAWFREMEQLGMRNDEAQERAARLRLDLKRADLKPLSSNPLLLTAMMIVSTRKERLLDTRPLVYRETVNLLLWQWDARKGKLSTDGEQRNPVLNKLIHKAGWTAIDLERILAQLAFEAQERTKQRDEQLVADIPELTLIKRLGDRRGSRHLDWANEVVNQLKQRTGLLVERAPGVLSFPHRTFQEYMAGRYLSTSVNFAKNSCRLLKDSSYWLEAVLLGIGDAVHVVGELDSPLFLLNRLCPDLPGRDEQAWRNVWFAGEALAEIGVTNALADEYGALIVGRVKQNLVALLEGGRLNSYERAKAATALGRIGDPRFRADFWFLPTDQMLGFVEISEEPFTMGSDKSGDPAAYDPETPRHTVELERFYISKWPVTVAQFKAFVEDNDNGGFVPADPECLRGVLNHPVTRIKWDEALAYCQWLTKKLRTSDDTPEPLLNCLRSSQPWRVTLPSEAEWEKAARGPGASVFPWGNEAAPDKANYAATGIQRLSAVGCFPAGRSAWGIEDLCGNVWEWTRSLWGKDQESPHFVYPYVADYAGNNRENLQASPDVLRVVRGGAFCLEPRHIRSSFRFWLGRFRKGRDVGFRVVLSPFSGNV